MFLCINRRLVPLPAHREIAGVPNPARVSQPDMFSIMTWAGESRDVPDAARPPTHREALKLKVFNRWVRFYPRDALVPAKRPEAQRTCSHLFYTSALFRKLSLRLSTHGPSLPSLRSRPQSSRVRRVLGGWRSLARTHELTSR